MAEKAQPGGHAVIGVSVSNIDLPIAREFFELFKTPWEPVVPGRHYRAVLGATGGAADAPADLLVAYGPDLQAADAEAGVKVVPVSGELRAEWRGAALPIYGAVAQFVGSATPGVLTHGTKPLQYRHQSGDRTVWRIGYDLFGEVRKLVSVGQPTTYAEVPTLDLHIALLRTLLLEEGVPVVEIPPRPAGFDFVCCLTHDIDFVGVRRHASDRTLAGFAVRGSVGTVADCARGRRPLADVARNGLALLSLPLVFAGLLPDPWRPFEDYLRADQGHPSTFFVIPFGGRPGIAPDGTVAPPRAAPYDLPEIRADVRAAAGQGSELAVHGIDAWRDAGAGRAELARLAEVAGTGVSGVRMHWLYFDQDSPRHLEASGFAYDSSWGYNDAIGYRAGTSQPFRFPRSEGLMELPLAIMDTAMFYPDRMGLTPDEAIDRCERIVEHARTAGGTVVVNWHDRSLAPERLWGRSYSALLQVIGDRAWFATAADAVSWFRWRRSIQFDASRGGFALHVPEPPPNVPPARLCAHRPGQAPECAELKLDGRGTLRLNL